MRSSRSLLRNALGGDSLEIRADFEIEKETKRTIRYKEIVPAGLAPKFVTIYIQKGALPNPAPKKIKVVVTA